MFSLHAFAYAGNQTSEDEMLRAALAMSMDQTLMEPPATAPPSTVAPAARDVDISSMTEEEQIAYALQMSMQATPSGIFFYQVRLFVIVVRVESQQFAYRLEII